MTGISTPTASLGKADASDIYESRQTVRKDVTRNRELLVAAANVVFARRGADATLQDIAKEAGLGNATVHRHFANKQALLAALFDDRVRRILDIFHNAEAQEDPWMSLEDLLFSLAQLQTDDKGVRQALTTDTTHDAPKAQASFHQVAERIVGRARRAGVLRPEFEARDIPIILRMIGSISDSEDTEAPELWRRYLELILDGAATPSRPRHAISVPPAPAGLATRSARSGNQARPRPPIKLKNFDDAPQHALRPRQTGR